MKEEKRQFPRLNLSVEIHWEKMTGSPDGATKDSAANNTAQNVSSDNSAQKSTMRDISAGGIRLLLNDKVKPGDILELDIKLTEGKSFRLQGRVVWVDQYEIIGTDKIGYEGGVQFLDVSDEIRQEISNFIFNIIGKKPV